MIIVAHPLDQDGQHGAGDHRGLETAYIVPSLQHRETEHQQRCNLRNGAKARQACFPAQVEVLAVRAKREQRCHEKQAQTGIRAWLEGDKQQKHEHNRACDEAQF